MTREKALKRLMNLIDELPVSWTRKRLAFEEVLAALSSPTPPPGLAGLRAGPVQRPPCACGGRPLLATMCVVMEQLPESGICFVGRHGGVRFATALPPDAQLEKDTFGYKTLLRKVRILVLEESQNELREAIAALSSCACRGREPVYTGGATVLGIYGKRIYLDTGSVRFYTDKEIGCDQLFDVLAFLPAEEEKA